MKRTKKRVMNGCIATALAAVIAFGGFGPAIAQAAGTENSNDKEDILYVSLGDSMTNGYGLEGYDGVSGIMNYGTNTYSNKFAAWLAGYEGSIEDDQIIFEGSKGTVEHRQLAMSGMDAETLLWMLELDHAGIVNTDDKAQDASGNWYSTMELYDIAANGWNGWISDGDNVSRKGVVLNEDGTDAVKINTKISSSDEGTECYSVHVPYFPDFSKDYYNASKNSENYKNGSIGNVPTNANGDYISNKTGSYSDLGASMWYDELGFTSGHYFRAYEDIFKDHQYRMGDGAAKIIYTYYGGNDAATGRFASSYMNGVDVRTVIAGVKANPEYPINNEQVHKDLGDDDWNWLRIAAEFYQESIKDADVISMAQGNTNFGTLMFNEIKNIVKGGDCNFHTRIGMALTDDPDFSGLYERAGLSDELSNKIDDLMKTEIDPLLDNMMGDMLANLKGYQKAEIKLVIKYCLISYLLSYTATVEHILEVNPDVTLIQVALMNAYASTDEESENSISMGSIIDMIYEPINAYIAALPTYMQATDNTLYKDATFYYADCGEVETLSEVFGNDFYKDADGNYVKYPGLKLEDGLAANEKSTIRNRFRYWIAGSGSNVTSKNYYLSSHGNPDYGEVWKGLLKHFVDNDTTNGDFFGIFDLMYVTDGDLVTFTNMSNEDIEAKLKGTDKAESDWVFSCLMYMAIEDAVIRSGKQSFDMAALGNFSGINLDSFADALESFYKSAEIDDMNSTVTIESLADLVALFQQFSDAMVNDPRVSVIFCLANRMEIGTGIGGHTSEGGHNTMYESIRDAYATGYTSADETKKILLGALEAYYPNLAAAIGASDGMTAIDDLTIIMAMLKASDNPALEGVDLDAFEAEIRGLNKYVDEELSYEDQEFVLELSNNVMDRVQNLASKATYSKYEVTEDSFYVSLGDSNVNGYGLDGYVDNMQNGLGQVIEGSAPVMLAQKLYGDDWQNHFGQYAQGALRSEDLLYILGVDEDIVLDDYYYDEIEGNLMNDNITDTRKAYIEALEKADLISVAIGGGNVTTFVGEQVDRIIAGEKLVEMDWAKLGVESDAMDELNDLLDTLVPVMDELGMMDKYLPEGMESVDNPTEFAYVLAESLLYGYASYNYYYTKVLDRIHEINPDAQLLILGMFNPVDDWTVAMEIEGEDKIVPIGGIINNIMESANLQSLAYALQNENTTFIDLSDNITFLDEKIAGGFEPTFADYYKEILEGNGKQVHASAAGHVYMTNQMYAALQEDYLSDPVKVATENLWPLIEKYYDDAYKYAYRYANDEGYIDEAIAGLDEVADALKAIDVDSLNASDEFKTELKEAIADALETIEQLQTLIKEADVLDDATYQEVLNLLGKLEDNLVDIGELLEIAASDAADAAYDYYVTTVRPAIEKALKEAVEVGTQKLLEYAQIAYDAFVEELVRQLPMIDEFLYDWFYENPDIVIEFFHEYGDEMVEFISEYYEEIGAVLGYIAYTYGDDVVKAIMEDPEGALEDLVAWYDKYGERTWDMIMVYADALGITDALEAEADKVYAALVEICNYMEKELLVLQEIIEAEIARIEAEITALKAELEAAGEEAKAVIEAEIAKLEAELASMMAQLEAYLENAFEELYIDATTGEYAIDADSMYVSLGDSVAASKNTFAGKLADTLASEYGLNDYVDLAISGFRAEDIRYLLDETYELDAYGVANTKEAADEARADYITTIKEADLITVTLGNDNFTSFTAAQLAGGNYEMDWSRFVTEDGVPHVEEALAKVADELITTGFDEDMAKTLAYAVECYAYGFAGYVANYTAVLDEIHALNPDAQVVVVGLFNPIDTLTLNLDDGAVALGEYVDYFISMSNQMSTIYAAITPNTTFVAVPDAETSMDGKDVNYYSYLVALLTASKNLLPNNAGHTYIKDQILNAMTITVETLKGDVNQDGIVDDADVNLLYRGVNKYVDLSAIQLTIGDVNEDGITDDADVNLLYRYVNHYVSAM